MTPLDLKTSFQKTKIPEGTLLVAQGTTISFLLVLHSGLAEEVVADRTDAQTMEGDELLAHSHRVGLIKGESVCGVQGLYSGKAMAHSIVALSECIVSNTPVPPEKLVQTLQSNLKFTGQILRAMVQRVESASQLFRNYRYLWHKLANIQDSIALADPFPDAMIGEHEPGSSPWALDRGQVGLDHYRGEVKRLLVHQSLPLPKPWDPNVFLGRVQEQAGFYREFDHHRTENFFDYPQYLFFKRLLRKPDAALFPIIENDEPSTYYIFNFLNAGIEAIAQENSALVEEIIAMATNLYGDGGWVDQIVAQSQDHLAQRWPFLHYLWKFSYSGHRDAVKLLRRNLKLDFSSYRSLAEFKSETPPEHIVTDSPVTEVHKNGSDPARMEKYRDLTRKLLDFSDLNSSFSERFLNLLQKAKGLDDIFATDSQSAQIRSKLSEAYWQLYEACFLKVVDTDLKSFIPGIMLHFGLVDETLVSEEQLAQLDREYSSLLYVEQPIPAMTLPYFLEKVYTGEVQPSMGEMGEGFRELLRRQNTMGKKERDSSYFYEDTAEDRVRYELRNVASTLSKMLFGSKGKALPFLLSDAIQGPMERLFTQPQTYGDTIQMVRERDVSLFVREVVARHKYGTDLIKKEVLPNLVVYPVVGSRMMMWQEIDGTKKDSPARFFVPLVFVEKLSESLTTLLAHFRWELSRTIAGANWMDPVEGGLAGAYYDYITFYKKNPNLSPGHKEKVAELVKKTRSDKERFAKDYSTWVLYEYDSKLRFNAVVREIFYRYCPFSAEVRKELATRPMFSDLETKFINRLGKELNRCEARMKKFEKTGEPAPEDMVAYLEMLKDSDSRAID